MWRRASAGSWVLKKSSGDMSDSANEYREASEGMALQIGESVVAYTYPLTEGLIIDRRVNDEGKLELTLLIAPFKKKGKKWSKARVALRDAARLSKKPPGKFLFSIKGVEQMRVEARRAKADPVWIDAVKTSLDKEFLQNELSSGDSEPRQKGEEVDSDDSEQVIQKDLEASMTGRKVDELGRRMSEVMKLRNIRSTSGVERTKKKKKEEKYSEEDFQLWKKWLKERKNRKEKMDKRKAVVSSLSTSSDSSNSSSSEGEPLISEVGEKGSSGVFACPFHKTDSRGYKDVRCQIQGQAINRKQVRLALYNFYSNFHTLEGFAEKFVHKAYSSPYRPFTVDVAWFNAYAESLDSMLLNSIHGTWALWNEPVVDLMFTGFLELLIRISPYKDYPACLDDTVRKWMKKKRIGTNTKFGPVPFNMLHAKFTEGGVVVSQQNGQRSKEKTVGINKQGSLSSGKTNTHPPQGGEKRPPPSS